MKDRYFVFAVTFAFIIPIIVGGIYFYNLYNKNDKITHIALLSEGLEVKNYGSNEIRLANNYEEAKSFDFDVYNSSNYSREYNISLKDIVIPYGVKLEGIKWRLLLSSDYGDIVVADGDFSSVDKDGVFLADNMVIGAESINKYKLYCYIESDNNVNVDVFRASVLIE